jgi:2-oxo-4-hydroxy-4-carboxy-5-ureidoimidazoline decarboxylase
VKQAAWLDALPREVAAAELRRCCGASRWVEGMLARRPFRDLPNLLRAAAEVWATMRREDVLEAFSHHPRIGGDLDALRSRFAQKGDLLWSAREQAGIASSDDDTLRRLSEGNRAYEARFGHVFVVCATGKSARQMLEALESRLGNEPDIELEIAAAEQAAITALRLQKLECS